MKRITVFFLILVLSVSAAFALQSTFGPESSQYKDFMTLCTLASIRPQGVVLPITSEQMLRILDRIPADSLNETASALYSKLRSELESPAVTAKSAGEGTIAADFTVDVSGQFIKQSQSEFDFLLKRKDRKPMLFAGTDLYFNDFLYGFFSVDITDVDNDATQGSTEGYKIYTTNFMKKLDILRNIDFAFPHKAFVSLGYEGMNLTVGRDKLSLGSGKTGNLILGNNLWYQDFIKASVVTNPVSYDFTVMSFENTTSGTDPLTIVTDYTASANRQLVLLHNFSFAPSRWLSLTLTEGALSYGSTAMLDLRKFNPFFLFHSMFDYSDPSGYNLGNMNNFFGAEIGVSLPYGLAFNTQCIFDQIQFNGEHNPDNPRGAFGLLANITKSGTLAGGVYDCYVEGVYTSPNLYLKESSIEYWNLDLIVGKKIYWPSSRTDEISYLGYQYGPDSFVAGAGFNWRNTDSLEIELNGLYRIHGTQGIKYYASQNGTTILYGEDPKTITGENPEKRLVLDLKVKADLLDWLSLEGEIGYISAKNYRNQADALYNDVQFAIGGTIKIDGFFNRSTL